MKVLTLNCLYPQYARSSGLPAKPWSARSDSIVSLIKQSGASVAGLQEISTGDAAAIASRLGWKCHASGLNAVIWDPSKLTLAESLTKQLSGADDRRAVSVRFQEGLTVTSTHLSHRNSIPGKSESRAKSYRAVQAKEVGALTKSAMDGGTIGVICADLNSTTRDAPGFPRPILAKAGFGQLRGKVKVVNGEYATSTSLKTPKKTGEWLDDILTNGEVLSGELVLVGSASDHNMLVADVQLKSPGTIRRGSSGRVVKALQKAIGVEADGQFGPKTEAAVVAFQRSKGLDPDGIVGPRTWAKFPDIHY